MNIIQDKRNSIYKIVDVVNNVNYINYTDNAVVWTVEGIKLTSIKNIKIELNRINALHTWTEHRETTKKVLAEWFCTEQINIDSILSRDEQIAIIAKSYQSTREEHTHQGSAFNYFNVFRSGLVYDYRHGDKTDTEIFDIESRLSGVTDKLITGDWMSARAILSVTPVGGSLTQSIIDGLLLDFNNYIDDNY